MPDSDKITRRDFLRRTAAGAIVLGAGALARPARSQVAGANERIGVGVIGCGGMGTGHLRALVDMAAKGEESLAVIAVCDIYELRKERAKSISGAQVFHDYHDMLQLPDLDAVFIATPDHWHARMAIDAMEAGKDVYVEKPMTLYWQEAKEVAGTASRTGRVLQVGAQSTSEDIWWQARWLIRAGTLGKLLWTQTGYCRNTKEGEWNWPMDPEASPQNLDWKRFLGSAPKRPFDPERFFRFRKYWDYSGGIATDLLYHQLAHLQVALGPEFPKRVVAAGGIYAFPDREVPDTFHAVVDYPTDHSVVMLSSMANRQSLPDVIRGHEATMYFQDGQVVVIPEDEFKKDRSEMRVKPEPRSGHRKNFFECMRSRKRPHCDALTGYKVMVAIGLTVESYRKQKAMLFDAVREEVVG
jgi:predicted dehydrogenase